MNKSKIEQIYKMDRKELITYCEKNNIKYRTKDSTNDIRTKVLKFSGVNYSRPSNFKKPIIEPVEKTEKQSSEIKFKQIGQNVIVIIDGQQYSKSEPDKEQRDTIKRLVESINKKRTHSDVEKLKKIFVNKTKKVEESLKSGKTIDIEILADRVNQITIQMNEMIDIIKKSYQGSQEAPKTQASVSERTGEKPYR